MSMFRDIRKPAQEIFEDDYIHGHNVKFKSTNSSQYCLSGEASFSPHKIPVASLSVNKIGPIFSLDKLRVKSDGRILAEASLKASSISKFTLSTEDGRQEPGKPLQSFGKIGIEVNTPKVQADASIDVVNGPVLQGSILYGYKDFKIGGEAMINTHAEDKDQSPELSNIDIGLSYTGPNWSAMGKTTDMMENVRLNYVQTVSPKLTVAAQVDYHLKLNSQRLAIGSEYKLDDKSSIKAKIDSNAILAGTFKQKLSDFVRLVVSTEVNVHDWSANSHKFGIGLTFE